MKLTIVFVICLFLIITNLNTYTQVEYLNNQEIMLYKNSYLGKVIIKYYASLCFFDKKWDESLKLRQTFNDESDLLQIALIYLNKKDTINAKKEFLKNEELILKKMSESEENNENLKIHLMMSYYFSDSIRYNNFIKKQKIYDNINVSNFKTQTIKLFFEGLNSINFLEKYYFYFYTYIDYNPNLSIKLQIKKQILKDIKTMKRNLKNKK